MCRISSPFRILVTARKTNGRQSLAAVCGRPGERAGGMVGSFAYFLTVTVKEIVAFFFSLPARVIVWPHL